MKTTTTSLDSMRTNVLPADQFIHTICGATVRCCSYQCLLFRRAYGRGVKCVTACIRRIISPNPSKRIGRSVCLGNIAWTAKPWSVYVSALPTTIPTGVFHLGGLCLLSHRKRRRQCRHQFHRCSAAGSSIHRCPCHTHCRPRNL